MPIPCKDIAGFLINELQRPQHFECNCIECGNVQGFNEAITQQGSVKLTLNKTKLAQIIQDIRKEFGVDNYELRGDNGDYTPNENEKFLMEDMLEGFIHELEDALITKEHELIEVCPADKEIE